MTSSVYFKFKSQKDPTRVEFDGTGISVFELKRDIIVKSGLGDGKDFDLAIYNEDNNEEFVDDTTIIPRSTSIIARRLPPMKPGAGRAARYVTGKIPMNAKNSLRKDATSSKASSKPSISTNTANMSNMTEEQRMAAMFAAQDEQWSAQQEEMALQTRVAFKGSKNVVVPDFEPPTGYVCYRCGEKGHWIQACPTNDDPNFDNKPRVKRTTGIPRSFLKTVEKPPAQGSDGLTDDAKPPPGIMVNAEGEYVIAEPDKKSWEQFQAKTKSVAALLSTAALGDKELQDRGLECPIDKRCFIDPLRTPCCEKTYCNDCITNALIENDFTCPGCRTEGILIDDLVPDVETSSKITQYLADKNSALRKEPSKTPIVRQQSPKLASETSKSPSPMMPNKSPPSSTTTTRAKSSTPETLTRPSQTATKKRPAEDQLENLKVPKGPKAMKQEEMQTTLQQQQQQLDLNATSGFPPMPFNSMIGMNGFGSMPNMNMNMNMGMVNGYGVNSMAGLPMMGMGGGMNGYGLNLMNGLGDMSSMNNMFSAGNGGYGGMGPMGMMGNGMGMGQQVNVAGQMGNFANQQKNAFMGPVPSEEDNAYFRQPVNPHRHQGRQRRVRPSDYREL